MSNYAIMRFQKYKLGSVANIERHQKYRERLHNRAHPEREKENISYSQYNETMRKTLKRAIKAQEKATGKKVRKDAVVLTEFVLTFSPEMENQIDKNEWIKANVKWLCKTFGKDKLLKLFTNADEKTFHIHAYISTYHNGKFNASKYFGKKSQIIELQDSYAESMAQFGLIRGESKEQTGARHQTLHEWKKSECERLEKELQEMKESVFADEKETTSPSIESEIFDDLR
ncbi:MAG: MobV family relaxase [Clostridia bacterium]|nr:MobV family relaxase [Clostridia bacterium]